MHKHIVTRTSERSSRDLHEEEVEVLDTWLWPVTELVEAPLPERKESVAVEVSLLPQTRRLLWDFPVPGLEWPYLRHLEQRIVRNPRDLLSHVRRLYLANALGDTDAVTGALTDLYLALGKEGARLRSRMLRLVGNRLNNEQLAFFEAHLEQGLDATEAMPELSQSRLSKRVIGTTHIVSRPRVDASGSDDPVRLARDSIARGHPDVAQAVLEGALESDPGNREVCEELLELYGDRNLRGDFYKTYTALLGRRLACRNQWEALARNFRLRVGVDG